VQLFFFFFKADCRSNNEEKDAYASVYPFKIIIAGIILLEQQKGETRRGRSMKDDFRVGCELNLMNLCFNDKLQRDV
jgi:hypothetical protein